MSFKDFKEKMQRHFKSMEKQSERLFTVDADKDEMWDLYLDSFPEGYNKIYRERREHDCSCCRSFVKNFGNVVAIKGNKITSLWDFDTKSEECQPVVEAMSKYIKSKLPSNVYVSKQKKIGTDHNFESIDGKPKKWEHFFIELSTCDTGSSSEAEIMGRYRDVKSVFKRSLDEISEDAAETVLELISSNTLYKGKEWEYAIKDFIRYKKEYSKLLFSEREIFAWEKSIKAGPVVGKIRNHSIGTLLVNVSEGMDLDTAVKKYESIVAPENYKRPKPIYTKKMLEEAKNKLQELGYLDSLERRYAKLDDITINNIIFSNKDSVKRMKNESDVLGVFDEMESEVAINPKNFSKVEEISIDSFIENVVPTARNLEVFLENSHTNNMVSLRTAVKDSKSMFKWDNTFDWSYSGNIADSSMKENVKKAGGNVNGVLRASLQWNDNNDNDSDLDLHCCEPNRNIIYYGNKRVVHKSSGMLDVDIISPGRKVAVENIIYTNKNLMPEGTYLVKVHCYNKGYNIKSGFSAEIEFDGAIHSFEYNKPLKQKEYVEVAEVTLKNGVFSIKNLLPSTTSSRQTWNLNTNNFHPVSVMMYSPNYWDDQKGIGHKHYFFMLKNCISDEGQNAFYNEFLKEDLNKHRKVFEALGGKMQIKDSEDQLSGVGFSSTKRNNVLVKVEGATKRIMRVKF